MILTDEQQMAIADRALAVQEAAEAERIAGREERRRMMLRRREDRIVRMRRALMRDQRGRA